MADNASVERARRTGIQLVTGNFHDNFGGGASSSGAHSTALQDLGYLKYTRS